MTLAEAGEIFAYWADNPPAHLMLQALARMLGWKPKTGPAPTLPEFAAMAPPGLAVAAGGDLGMPSPVLDIEVLRSRNRARLANRAESL
jgi:hypothetical protein